MRKVLLGLAAGLLCGCGGSTAPTGVTLASGQNNPGSIVVDWMSVYWATDALGSNVFAKVPLSGGTPVLLAAGDISDIFAGIAVDSTFGYYVDVSTIMQVPLSGGLAVPIVSGGFLVGVDSTSVYWVSGPPETLMKTPSSGGAPVALAALNSAENFAIGPTGVYWTGSAGSPTSGTVMMVGLDGGTPVTLASGGYPYGIAVDSTNVYWTDPFSATVMKVGLSGGTPVTLVSGVGAGGIAVDSTGIYFTVAGFVNGFGCSGGKACGGSVMKAPLGGGVPVTVAVGDNPARIAVDSTSVYWTDASAGTIMKAPK